MKFIVFTIVLLASFSAFSAASFKEKYADLIIKEMGVKKIIKANSFSVKVRNASSLKSFEQRVLTNFKAQLVKEFSEKQLKYLADYMKSDSYKYFAKAEKKMKSLLFSEINKK